MAKIVKALTVSIALATSVAGCWEADPDKDTLGDLRDQVAGFPIEVKHVMASWAANRVAYGYILNNSNRGDDHLGTIRCVKDDKPHFSDPVFDLPVGDMLACLNKHGTSTYFQCLKYLLEDAADEHPDRECSWIGFRTGLSPDEVPDEFKAERATVDDITRALLGPPPPLEIQLLLMGLPGIMGPSGAFCIQRVDWACAPDPFGGPPGTSASSGGGDR